MSFAQLEDSFASSIKVRLFARELGIPAVLLRGHLATLWSWALTNAPDGDLSHLSPEAVELVVEWEGEPGRFAEVITRPLAKFGPFVDRTEDGGLAIHDWDQRAGSMKRAADARAYRARKKAEEEEAALGDAARPSRGPREAHRDPRVITRDPREAQKGKEKRGKKGKEPRELEGAAPPVGSDDPAALAGSAPVTESRSPDAPEANATGPRSDDRSSAPPPGGPEPPASPGPSQAPLALVAPGEEEPGGRSRLAPYIEAWNRGASGKISKADPPSRRTKKRDEALAREVKRFPEPREWEACARALSASDHHQTWGGASLGWLLERGNGAKLEKWMAEGARLGTGPPPRPSPPPVAPQRMSQVERLLTGGGVHRRELDAGPVIDVGGDG